MQCRFHPTKAGINTCNSCGAWLCDDCTCSTQGRIYCNICLVSEAPPSAAASPVSMRPLPIPKRSCLKFLSLFFPPGVNYMYLGLIKRGLAAMGAFFMLIFLIANSNAAVTLLAVFSMIILYFACFFDSLAIHRRWQAGVVPKDDIDDILNFAQNNCKWILGLFLVVAVIGAIGRVVGALASIMSNFIPLIIIGLGVYLLFIKPRKPKE